MRGYATIVASLIMFTILVTSVSVLFATSIGEHAKVREAQAFSSAVKSLREKIVLSIVYTDWNGDTNVFVATLKNTGTVPVDMNDVAFFINGVLVGRCGNNNITCRENSPDGQLLPFEEVNVSFSLPYNPHRVGVSGGPTFTLAYPTQWRAGCKYRRMVVVTNPSDEDLTGYPVPVDLPPGFDYSRAEPDGSDVLFTLSDGVTAVPHWTEYWNDDGKSRLWVSVDVPAGASAYYYMYYGGCSATQWSAEDLFDMVIPGLVSYWNFEEGRGNTARDVSGNGHDMELHNVEWSSGPRGGALCFYDGNNSYGILRGFNDFPSKSITVFFRMLRADTPDDPKKGTPFSYATGDNKSGKDNEFLVYNYDDFCIYRRDDNRRHVHASASRGVWHHVAVSWDIHGRYSFYIDGNMTWEGDGFAEGNPIETNGTLVLGQEQDEEGGGFDVLQSFVGCMDDVIIFDRVLSGREINAVTYGDIYVSKYTSGALLVRRYVSPAPRATLRGEERI